LAANATEPAAQDQFAGEHEALAAMRQDMTRERAEMLAEIARIGAVLERDRVTIRESEENPEDERRVHAQAASEAREAKAIAEQRQERITAQEREFAELRDEVAALRSEAATLRERLSPRGKAASIAHDD